MQSFTYAEYTSVALAKVWSNKAKIPSTPELWRHHEQHVKDLGGYGKHFQYLGAERTDGGCCQDAARKTKLTHLDNQHWLGSSLVGWMPLQSNMVDDRYLL